MSALLDTARRLLGRDTDVGERVAGLGRAVQECRGRLDDEVVQAAEDTVARTGERLRLSAEHTVVALAGSTGSGKSSTFNALAGLDLAAVGVRRPTTSWATACVWGAEGAGELLDWLAIPRRHQVSRDSTLDDGPDDAELRGLVLMDLPDHDSTEVSHHLEVDRLVGLVDLMVWVLDPQKYADAALHERYLAPMARHAGVTLVVLNHIDEVPPDQRETMLEDLRRLLDADGLGEVPVLATAAPEGTGMAELREEVAVRVRGKSAATARLLADVLDSAQRLDELCGNARPRGVSRESESELVEALADAAGVPTVVDAVERSSRLRARRATGWPATAWLARLRPDPLRRLHLRGQQGRDDGGDPVARVPRTSLPEGTAVERARVDAAVRSVAEHASTGLTRPWAGAVRRASVAASPDIADALDRAVSSTQFPGLPGSRAPWWWRGVQTLQWLLMAAAVVGAVWLGGLAVAGFLRVTAPDPPAYAGFALPTLLLLGGVLAGLVVAGAARGLARLRARAHARSADRRLRASVRAVADDLVLGPVQRELEAYRSAREGLDAALR